MSQPGPTGRVMPRSSVASPAVPPLPGVAGSPASSAGLLLSRAAVGITDVFPPDPTVLPLLAASKPSTGSTGADALPIWSPVAVVNPQPMPTRLWRCEGRPPLVMQSGAE